MDPLRTLLLARTHLVVLDPDLVASAVTRPSRDVDLDRFEDELAQLGFVMSLDLAMTVRRMPFLAVAELRTWVIDTLVAAVGAHRPYVPLFRQFAPGTPPDAFGIYPRRVLTWLRTRPHQPCPWCTKITTIGALDPCGHLVCRSCWTSGNYAGCPICHRRVAVTEPFVHAPEPTPAVDDRVLRHDGQLRLLHLGFDLVGSARARFEGLLGRSAPLSPGDRAEIEAVIDVVGPRAAMWLPKRIPVRESMAVALARLWMIAPDRSAMARATQDHLTSATDLLRVATVLMGGHASLIQPQRLASIPRGLRRAVLEALDRLPVDALVEDMRRHPGLWKRAGERLHPYEHAARLPTAALAFAVVRGTSVEGASFGDTLRAQANQLAAVRIEDDRVRVNAWAGAIEDGLRAGAPRAVIERLASRPAELLRRADHLVRVTQAAQPDALGAVVAAIAQAATRGSAATLFTLAGHLARRGEPWTRRVMFPHADVLRAWTMPDHRAPLRADAIDAIVGALRRELAARAGKLRHFARAVIDRGLGDLAVPIGERTPSKAHIAWPRGSEVALPAGQRLRLILHWEAPPGTRAALDLSVTLFDAAWRYVATCTTEAFHTDLDLDELHARGARHAVMTVFSRTSISFDRLTYGFAAVARVDELDPRAVAQRFDLRGRSLITVPLAIDLEARRLRWLDVHIAGHDDLQRVGGYRAALAHVGRDFAELAATGARPSLWELACIHAAARANVVYIRERDGTTTTYRRRDGEAAPARLHRLLSACDDDGTLPHIPPANAPAWLALLRDDLPIVAGSAGYVLDARATGGEGFTRHAAADLLAELAPTL